MSRRLDAEISSALRATLPQWTHDPQRDALARSFRFADFAQAFAFMTRLALVSERMNHHPEWFNVYNRVEVVLTTHDANGVSEEDVALAQFMDQIAG